MAETVVTRLAIDHLRSARVRREQYTGTWLPEPVLADPAPDAAVRAESLSMAVLVLLESLTPVERAVFVLREAFDYGYDEIAEIVGKSEDELPPARDPRPAARGRAAAALRAVARAARGVGAALHRSAPGGRDRSRSSRCWPPTSSSTATAAARRPPSAAMQGAEAVARAGRLLARGPPPRRDRQSRRGQRRARPARLRDGRLVAVWTFEFSGDAVQAIRGVTNPDKLAHISSTILPSLPPALKRS